MTLIAFELRRMIARRGSFYSTMAVTLLVALLWAAFAPQEDQSGGAWTFVIGIPAVFGATIVGSLAGSYDTAQGTMRYLVLTGVPRWWLVVLRVPALILTVAATTLPAALVGLVAMLTGPDETAEILRGVFGGMTYAAVWGVVAMAVGTLLRSNGAGIAVALVLFLGTNFITIFVAANVSETLGELLLPNAVAIVAFFGAPDDGVDVLSFPAALAVLVVWMAAIIGAAVVRAQRDEY